MELCALATDKIRNTWRLWEKRCSFVSASLCLLYFCTSVTHLGDIYALAGIYMFMCSIYIYWHVHVDMYTIGKYTSTSRTCEHILMYRMPAHVFDNLFEHMHILLSDCKHVHVHAILMLKTSTLWWTCPWCSVQTNSFVLHLLYTLYSCKTCIP
jgi:hypothetical protein